MTNKETLAAVQKAANFIKQHLQEQPEVGIITGTGLSGIIASMSGHTVLAYEKIPYFPVSTVTSHPGRLIFGRLANRPVIALQGRFHLYEGYSPFQVTFPVRVLQRLGVKTLILSNAAGGLNLNFQPGDLMLITDHINLTGQNPLIGKNNDQWGVRFPDMINAYPSRLIELAKKSAQEMDIPCHTGVYAGLTGPSLETPSETRFLRMIGADAVGFSTVQESIAAVHANMEVLGISLLTNINDPDHPAPTTLEAVLQVARESESRIERLLQKILPSLSP